MNRLECIKSVVSKCKIAADIGTDHGYVAEMLLRDNVCEKVIATDLNEGPLNSAIKHLTDMEIKSKCDFRLGSGLTVLREDEADAIIIAGMGGELIADILENSKNIALKATQLILQPMTTTDRLRYYLYNNGFKIMDEKIVKELYHYYFIIKAVPGKDRVEDDIFYEVSKILLEKKDPLMVEYLERMLGINEKIIRSIEKNNNSGYNKKIKQLKDKNKKIKELMKN